MILDIVLEKIVPRFIVDQLRNGKRKKLILQNAGNKVTCSICNHSFAKFGVYGNAKRENAFCFNCDSLERHRLMWLFLSNKLGVINSDKKVKILHFAPERTLYNLFNQMNNVDYTSCDLYPEYYNFDGKNKVDKVDITKIPYSDNQFDLIICNHVLEHIPDDRLAISELLRVMKPGGQAIVQVPIDYNRSVTYEDFSIISPEARLQAFGQKDHVRWYGCDYPERLRSVGFRVNEDAYASKLSSGDQYKYGIMPEEVIYHCLKD
jgi:SAM-dependent methyltransferase